MATLIARAGTAGISLAALSRALGLPSETLEDLLKALRSISAVVAATSAFGRHDAIGFSPIAGGIDRRLAPDYDLISGYDLITQLTPLILEHTKAKAR